LEGIAAAPRGMPQIEVKFDIDANGILNVAAKDLGTGKEQTVRIEKSSGLSKDEIDKMTKDAEAHAADDKKKRDLAEARNQADSLSFQVEKLIKENEGKLSGSDKKPLEDAVTKTREAAKGHNVEAIRSAINELEQAFHAVGKVLHESATAGPTAGAATDGAGKPAGEDEAIDAEFEVKE